MQKILTILTGLSLLLFGVCALAGNLLLPGLGIRLTWLEPWRYWPLIVLGVGTLFFMLGLFSIRKPGFGAFFIPAIPINVTGALLFVASLFDMWQIWSFGWAFVVLGLAVGFLFASVATRNLYLGIPAIVLGANGLVLSFCSITGLWSWWSVLWTIEPLVVGLVLMLIAFKSGSPAVKIIGAAISGFALLTLFLAVSMSFMNGLGFRLLLPVLLFVVGGLLLARGTVRLPLHKLEQ